MNKYVVALVAGVLFTMLAGCNAAEVPSSAASMQGQVESMPQAEETLDSQIAAESSSEKEPEEQKDIERIAIETQFGTLYYQEQWREFMRVELAGDSSCVTVDFEAEINGVRYPLFQVSLGQADGDPVKQIADAQGATHNVYVSVYEMGEHPMLTEGEQNRLYAMQEEINYVLENIK